MAAPNYAGRLRDANVPKMLEDMGASQELIDRFIVLLCGIPAQWKSLTVETKKEERQRRQRLAKHIRSLAAAFKADPEASSTCLMEVRRTTTSYELHFGKLRTPHAPMLADLLEHFAADFEEAPGFSLAVDRRMKLEVFAPLKIYMNLKQAGMREHGRSPTLKTACAIASALLAKKINGNSIAHHPAYKVLGNPRERVRRNGEVFLRSRR